MNEPDNASRSNIFFRSIIPVFLLIFIIIAGFLLFLSFYAPTIKERMQYGMALVISGIPASVVLYYLFMYGLNYARILKVLGGDYFVRWEYPKAPGKGDVYFCDEGVYDTDRPYQALDTFGDQFLDVEIPADKPSVIRFTKRPHRKGFADIKRTQDVPIPPGKEEEAEKMVERFLGYISRSSKFQKDQTRFVLWLLGGIFGWIILSVLIVMVPLTNQFEIEKFQRDQDRTDAKAKETINRITPLWSKIRQTIEPKIEGLKTLPAGQLTATEAGFDDNPEILAVFYGNCPSNEFYVSVVLKKVAVEQSTYAPEKITGAFNYTTTTPFPPKRSDSFCRPKAQTDFGWRIELTDGWIYGEIDNRPYLPKPDPSPNSPANKVKK